ARLSSSCDLVHRRLWLPHGTPPQARRQQKKLRWIRSACLTRRLHAAREPDELSVTCRTRSRRYAISSRAKSPAVSSVARAAASREPYGISDTVVLEGGKPEPGKLGVQPEWFYKGDGSMLVAPEHALTLPDFALDGGEEPEICGLYL